MTRGALLLAALTTAACSSLGDTGEPIAIETITPSPPVVDIGDTITLAARLLDQQGDSVAGTIRWRTPDTTLAIDSVTGAVTGLFTGSGKVQAISGSLVGPFVTFSVRPSADTVIITAAADSILVLTTDTVSVQLPAKVADSTGTGLSGRILSFTIVAPPSPAGALLTGDVTADTVTTGSDGTSAPIVRVRKVGVASGDSVIVQVEARRPSGKAVPGSGQRIRVFFQ